MRDRLEHEVAVLEIAGDASGGAVSAERRVSDGWSAGLAELVVVGGELVISAEPADLIAVEGLALELAPIEIPETVLGYGVQLTDIRIDLARPVRVPVTWTGPDASHGEAALPIELTWSLVNHGDTSPLGSPELAPVPAELVVTGDAGVVHAELRLTAPGELWRWADLVRLADLQLDLVGETH